jgi:hypothetical protein
MTPGIDRVPEDLKLIVAVVPEHLNGLEFEPLPIGTQLQHLVNV